MLGPLNTEGQNTLKFFMNSVSTPVSAFQERKHQDRIEALGISTLPLCVVDQRTYALALQCGQVLIKSQARSQAQRCDRHIS